MVRALSQPVLVYRVGGSVRDELLGRPVVDHDYVVVGGTPELMLASGFRPVGRDFPVFLHPETQEEYALARTERKHGQGYRGFRFFASPDVTLLEDLARRDLTINAMARGADGALVDPHGGAADLAAGVLRHVSPAFAEDPLRVLRVARFAARFGFTVAPATEALMRTLVDSGELATLAPERVWQELARGLMEAHPSRMFAVLRDCGALAALLPEVDALFGIPQPPAHHPEVDTGVHVVQALDWAAARHHTLPARYAVLAHDLGKAASPAGDLPRHIAHEQRSVRLAQRLSERLRVPQDCRDAAVLTARHHGVIHRAAELRPATVLDLVLALDALRRPERMAVVLDACAADACSRPGAAQDYAPAAILADALAIIRAVPVAAVAKAAAARAESAAARAKAAAGRAEPVAAGAEPAATRTRTGRGDDAIAAAIRTARLAALRRWRRTAGLPRRTAGPA